MQGSRHSIAVAGLTLISLAACSAPAGAQQKIETVFRDARAYTVRIRAQIETAFLEDDQGSVEGAGFLIDAQRRWVLTNAHVVGLSPASVQVAFADGIYRPARKVYVDSFIDMAVLELVDDGKRHPVAALNCGQVPQVGEGVGAYGHPLGIPFTGTRGIVSGTTDQYLTDFIQIDATVDHGNSGGPVISLRDGRVVGIATAKAGDNKADRLNLATPMADVCRILDLLRRGVAPDPPLMEFVLLVDEDNRHTVEVGHTYNAERWPFEPGDRILSVGPERRPITTLGSLVSALRGRHGKVPVRVMRAGRETEIQTFPAARPGVVARRGISIDGALIAPLDLDDGVALAEPAHLTVQSVAPGSAAEALGMDALDIVHSIDGRSFADLDSLAAYLDSRQDKDRIRIVFRRFTADGNRWLDFHVRELPGEDIQTIGPETELLSSGP